MTKSQWQPVGNNDYTKAAVVIIGAGISGMCTAIDLIRRNKCENFIILEKSSSVGGTWHDNKYPGARCDVCSLLYSFSFEQKSDWSRLYPGQEEIEDYLQSVARKYGLYKYIRFNTEVDHARWDDSKKKWTTKVKVSGNKDQEFGEGYEITSDYLVSAVGQLNLPRYPDIPGINDFQGKKMHSARWDWSYNMERKRIGVIGNGATAIQIIPEVAKYAKSVTVFQRTPNWIVPRMDSDVSSTQKTLYKYAPALRHRVRALMMDFRETFFDAVTNADSDFAQLVREQTAEAMKRDLPNQPELWKILTPNYNPGCKRVLLSDDYYQALNRNNVFLETRKINGITESGIELADGHHEEFDLIVFATGFRTVEFMHPMKIIGANGREINEIWRDGAQAYFGITVEDLPNFSMLYGPNTNLGHNSIILMIESQSKYINAMIAEVLKARTRGKSLAITPRKDVVKAHNEWMQSVLNESSFADSRCSSWYKTKEGKITNNWCGTVVEYQQFLSKLSWEDYDLKGTAAGDMAPRKPVYLGRVVEETKVSNTQLLLGLLSVAAVTAGFLNQNGLRKLLTAH